ncbi:HIT family protein [Piscinibacter koreensis]|uniref:HIT family protein n=1 Tax=Piscinibacter koreensis TaxID=2742824 RepID=A0A7Y6NL53_9BURK|nr:HIT family protein [Schlegelella koreensis]NUZ05230.1 HIT family protein [Schlegelella koreensis]
MANATETKFGDPAMRLAQGERWTVLLRPKQPTLGSLVLVCREPVRAFSDVSVEGFAEMRAMVRRIEATLREVVGYERINYLMLMMVDPDVHLHVIPRYAGAREFAGTSFPDAAWPGPPALEPAVALDADAAAALLETLRDAWSRAAG